MPKSAPIASQATLKINGHEAQADAMKQLAALEVEQHAYLPAMFTLRFHDPDLALLDGGLVNLTDEVEIAAEDQQGRATVLIQGEVIAIEPEFHPGMIAELVVRGYDKSHRLYRTCQSKAFLNVKDSDLADEIASSLGIEADIEATSTVYDHVFQHNQSALGFLRQRAWRIGYECYLKEGRLVFRKPPSEASAQVALTWGADLLAFYPRLSLAEQVDEVMVRGWDIAKLEPIVGRAEQGTLYPHIGEAKDGAQWASSFGSGKNVVVHQPLTSQAEADILAAARLNEHSSAFIQAEGVALRRPDIAAGQSVHLEGLGERFSGVYLVTSACHAYTPEGLQTTFQVRGTRHGLMNLEAASAASDRWPGIYPAVVTNIADPEDWGRVKVKFPWLSDEAESNWARVIGVGAGPEAGLYVMPAVGDEVMVAFGMGDFDQPVVLGSTWNGKHAIPSEAQKADGSDKHQVRTWHSRDGHRITVYDGPEKKIEIVTKDGQQITLDDGDGSVHLKTSDVNLRLAKNKLEIEAGTEISLKAGSNLKLEANGNIDIKASGQVTVKGAVINLN